jgi:hypothetical protein
MQQHKLCKIDLIYYILIHLYVIRCLGVELEVKNLLHIRDDSLSTASHSNTISGGNLNISGLTKSRYETGQKCKRKKENKQITWNMLD